MFDANIETSCNYSLYIIVYVKLVFWYFYKLKFHFNHKMYKEKSKKKKEESKSDTLVYNEKFQRKLFKNHAFSNSSCLYWSFSYSKELNRLRPPPKLNLLSSYLLIQ